MLGSFFEEDSPVYKDFNMKADYSKRKFDILTTIDVYFEIVTGLKFLFIRLRKSKQYLYQNHPLKYVYDHAI